MFMSIIVSPSCRSRLMFIICLYVFFSLFSPFKHVDLHWSFGHGQFFDTCLWACCCGCSVFFVFFFAVPFCQYTNELMLALFLASFIYTIKIYCMAYNLWSCLDFIYAIHWFYSMLMKVQSTPLCSRVQKVYFIHSTCIN